MDPCKRGPHRDPCGFLLPIPSEAGCACLIANRFARQVGRRYHPARQSGFGRSCCCCCCSCCRDRALTRGPWLPLPCAANRDCDCDWTCTCTCACACTFQGPCFSLGLGLGKESLGNVPRLSSHASSFDRVCLLSTLHSLSLSPLSSSSLTCPRSRL